MAFEIKFRIWDKTQKEFISKGITVTQHGKLLKFNQEVTNPENYKLLASTNMLDKYDKEIFEEDILEHTVAQAGTISQSVGIVRYDAKRAVFYLDDAKKLPLAELFSLRKLGNPYENSVLYDLYVKKQSS
ncbi:MAG: YopX family protein [Leptospiraceae bacterium]|nr:YopX family protein [Leptospiraceae bacterium]